MTLARIAAAFRYAHPALADQLHAATTDDATATQVAVALEALAATGTHAKSAHSAE